MTLQWINDEWKLEKNIRPTITERKCAADTHGYESKEQQKNSHHRLSQPEFICFVREHLF